MSDGAETKPEGKPIPYRMRRSTKPKLPADSKTTPGGPASQTLASSHDLYEYLKQQLEHDRRAHPSFKLMEIGGFDEQLVPGIKRIEFTATGRVSRESGSEEIWSIIQKSWDAPENHTVVMTGAGGIGKTVTLLQVPTSALERRGLPAVYIPMHCLLDKKQNVISISAFLEKRYGKKRGDAIEALAGGVWEKGPRLLVLLDGFNEVAGDRRDEVLDEVTAWSGANPGAQLLAVSRPMDLINLGYKLPNEPISITLNTLPPKLIRSKLEQARCGVPKSSSQIWKDLKYPLFLMLYLKTGKLPGRNTAGYPLAVKSAQSGGALIWNYLQRELLRPKENTKAAWDWTLRCAVACEYLLPYVAFQMQQRDAFRVDFDTVSAWIDEAVEAFPAHWDPLPKHLKQIKETYRQKNTADRSLDDLCRQRSEINWIDATLHETGVLVPYQGSEAEEEDGDNEAEEKEHEAEYAFMHQNFRDCLAAIHLINQAEAAGDMLPAAWAGHQDTNVLDYAAELMEPEAFQSVWEANRNTKPTNHTATATLLELARRKKYDRNETLPEMDFSGMDLRGFSLTRYLRQDTNLGWFHKPDLSEKTELDFASFRSPGHFSLVSCLLLTSSGLVVSGSWDDTLRVWDPATGECLRTLKGHTDWVDCVMETKGGQLVSGSSDNTLRVWDPATGECLRTLKGHRGAVNCVIETKGSQLVSGSDDSALRVWDPATGECLRTLEGHRKVVYCVIETKGGQLVSGSSDNTLRVWDPATGECLRMLEEHRGSVNCVIETKGGQLVSGSDDNTLRVWDPATGECLRTLEGHRGTVYCVIETKGGQLVSGSLDNTLRVWDPATGECLRTLEGHREAVSCVIETKGGQFVSGSGDNTLRVWDPATGECLRTLEGHTNMIYCVIKTKGGQLVSGSSDNTLRVWDPATGECLRTLEGHTNMIYCVIETKGGQFVSGSSDNTLRVWDPATGECLRTLEGHEDMAICVIETKGGQLVSGSGDNTLRVWDPATGECLRTLEGHEWTVTCVIETKGGQLVSGSGDNTLRVWDPATGECLRTLEGHTNSINCVIETKGGQLVSGSWDNTLRVWDPATGECLRTLEGHGGAVRCVIETKDGQLVSGSDDNTLRVWDPATGQCLRMLEGHTNWVDGVIETKSGQFVSGSGDRTMRVWDLSKGIGRECVEVLYPMEAGVSVMGLDFSRAVFPEDPAAALPTMLWQNGAAIPGKRSWTKSEPSTE